MISSLDKFITFQWVIDGETRRTTGHGESERLIRIKNSAVPELQILICEVGNSAQAQDHFAEHVRITLDTYFRMEKK